MIDQYYENSNEKRKKNEIVLLLQLKTKSKVKKESYIGLTQENLMEFQIQSVYLIYT